MAVSLGSNIASLQAQTKLAKSADALSAVYERLSSGQRINKASDDAAGLAIAESLNTNRRVFTQGIRNFNDGLSALSIADGATQELANIVIRIRELATQAANGAYSSKQRSALDSEAQELSEEYTRISKSVEFNGLRLFDGSVDTLRLQGGYGTDAGIASSFGGVMGDGSFGGAVSYSMESFYSVASSLGDLNGDAILDLVTAGITDGYQGYATVRLGTGNGTFTV